MIVTPVAALMLIAPEVLLAMMPFCLPVIEAPPLTPAFTVIAPPEARASMASPPAVASTWAVLIVTVSPERIPAVAAKMPPPPAPEPPVTVPLASMLILPPTVPGVTRSPESASMP